MCFLEQSTVFDVLPKAVISPPTLKLLVAIVPSRVMLLDVFEQSSDVIVMVANVRHDLGAQEVRLNPLCITSTDRLVLPRLWDCTRDFRLCLDEATAPPLERDDGICAGQLLHDLDHLDEIVLGGKDFRHRGGSGNQGGECL